MRFVPIDRAEPGMQLSKTIFDADHRILLGAYMELTEEFISKLQQRGLPGFYIEDKLTKDIIINEAITEELRGKAVSCLVNGDIDSTISVAREIVEQLKTSDIISLDLIDLRTFDEYTYRHSVNVAVLSTLLGIGMNLTNDALLELCTAAILHDLGKLSIDPAILNKPGKLSDEEYTMMKAHSRLSYELIKNKFEISSKSKNAVLYHHENVDGSGYPDGLKEGEIHQMARIIHVADVYDALTTSRPYKSAFSPRESIDYLISRVGIMFDRKVVETFVRYVPAYPKGVSVMLSTGEEAVVVENNMDLLERPVIRMMDGRTIDLANDPESQKIFVERIIDNVSDRILCGEDCGKKHILVVDDMVVNLKAIEGILQDCYRISLAKTVGQAKQFLRRRCPDLIVMDIDMPEIDGIEAAKYIHNKINSAIPIIFVSALNKRGVVLKSKEVNANDYIVKPFKPLYLINRIRDVLGDGSLPE